MRRGEGGSETVWQLHAWEHISKCFIPAWGVRGFCSKGKGWYEGCCCIQGDEHKLHGRGARKDSALTSGFPHLNWTPGELLWAFPTLSHCLCHDSWHCCGLCHPADELWMCFGARGSQQEAGPPALVGALVPTHPQRWSVLCHCLERWL